ncbi:Na+/H+ antiporter subunit D [Bacillus sp. Marseille-P3661]|uniref:Na+/H+ antiporter subunit D n=1 Tax=Bacillus sp. Marseille-P3661 TaxID=1936234 RepID=UPI000C831935|nr:Na+/H+ antiporter subunit D [Bacillus sp. Marseille-P3661]
MNNLVILPILIPLLTGIILVFFRKNISLQRWISGLSALLTIIVAVMLVQNVFNDGIQILKLSNWEPPFGVVFVADMLSALLVLTTSILSLACVLFAFRSIGIEREKYYFYSFFQFLITGVMGAFLTGDIFNLFVFFEVLLMASYVLLILGGTKIQFNETSKYILVNVISSALFVSAVAYLYSVTGTLNIADLSVKVAEVGQGGLLTVIAILFIIVFGIKGAIFPLYTWLPASYHAPPTVVTAIFGGLLTKVGVYSIMRTSTVIFNHQPEITHQLIGILALLTIILGAIGAVAYWDIKQIIIYNIIIAVGVILFGLSVNTETALEGSLFYLIHDMIIKVALFLLAGAVIVITGTSNIKKMGGLIKHHPLLGWMFFVAAIALVGVPPLSGFVGKLLILQGGFENGNYLGSAIVLISSLLVLYSMMKIFMNVFWRETVLSKEDEKGSTKGLLLPCAILVVLSIAYGVGSEWMYQYIEQAVAVLVDPSIYVESVLKE